jgi:transposase
MKAMAKHRIHSIEFKRQIAQDFIAGETLHALAGRHDVSRNLIRIWVRKFEAGAFDDEARAADLLQDYEAKIAALERMVGRQALEIEFLKGALKSAPRPRSASTSEHPFAVRLQLTPAGMHQRRRHPGGRRTLPGMRLPSAAAAAVDRVP